MDDYRKHIIARRLGAIELMVLLLQYPLTRCSVSVYYLPSALSELRSRSIKPMHLLNNLSDDVDDQENYENSLCWDDAIDKYYDRPDHEIFQTITYPDYHRNYIIKSKPPCSRSTLFHSRDCKNRIIVQHKSPILLRFASYKVEDGEPFFFNILL